MALVDLDEFKQVLEVGNIYADELLQEAIDTAENIVLSFLTFNKTPITAVKLESNVAFFYAKGSKFVVGQALTVSGCGSPFDGSRTVTEVWVDGFKAAITNADITLREIIPTGSALLTSQAALYDTTPEVREAAMAIACDVWISRSGTMGQQGVDFQPAPYRLGRSMMTRVSGLLAKHLDPRGMVG